MAATAGTIRVTVAQRQHGLGTQEALQTIIVEPDLQAMPNQPRRDRREHPAQVELLTVTTASLKSSLLGR